MPASKMYSPSESDWAWLAGIIDGEGYISMVASRGRRYRSNPARAPFVVTRRLAITNCNLPLLITIACLFGGKIHTHTAPPTRHRQQFQWYVYGSDMIRILSRVYPRLVSKRQEAALFLRTFGNGTRNIGDRRFLSEHTKRRYIEVVEEVKQLRKQTWTRSDVPDRFRPEPKCG